MDLLKSELLYKLRNMIDPEYKKKDFTFYIYKIKKVAPLSYDLLGEEFFLTILPLYFKEVAINEENLIENIYYLPLYFKKYQAEHQIKDHILELMDYEFSKYQIEIDSSEISSALYNKISMEVFLNPMAQAIRLEYDIHEYVKSFHKKPSKHLLPKKNKTLLLLSKKPSGTEVIFNKGNMHHAAIIDELHDGKVQKKDLLITLQNKYPAVAQSEWVIALKMLKDNFFVLES